MQKTIGRALLGKGALPLFLSCRVTPLDLYAEAWGARRAELFLAGKEGVPGGQFDGLLL